MFAKLFHKENQAGGFSNSSDSPGEDGGIRKIACCIVMKFYFGLPELIDHHSIHYCINISFKVLLMSIAAFFSPILMKIFV